MGARARLPAWQGALSPLCSQRADGNTGFFSWDALGARAGITRLQPVFVKPPLGSSFIPKDLCGIAAQQRKGLF